MTDYLRRTWAEIDLDALSHNAAAIRSQLQPDCKLMAVVKADAYGHGDRMVAEALREQVEWFGVSNLDEALSLRGAGIAKPILIFGYTPPDSAGVLAQNHISQTVFCEEYAAQLERAAAAENLCVGVHLKLDSGMGRLGFDCFSPEEAAANLLPVSKLPHLLLEGAFTHFAAADEEGEDAIRYTREQFWRFKKTCDCLEALGVNVPLRHCCNSAATMRFPEMHLNMVRPGLILYGLYPDMGCRSLMPLRPVMQLKSTVAMVKRLPKDRFVSYGRIFRSGREMRIATVPIGYADGYPRSLSNTGEMLVGGERARVLGRVCMDQLMLDVSDTEHCRAGDEVVVFGAQDGEILPADELAMGAGTISYELVCLVGKRVPRVYLQGGVQVAVRVL